MEDDGSIDHIPGGYILLARRLQGSPIWDQDHHHLRLWIYLLLNARWNPVPENRRGVTVCRGKLLKSYRRIIEESEWLENQEIRRWSLSRVGRMLDWLREQEMIETLGTDLGTIRIRGRRGKTPPPQTPRL